MSDAANAAVTPSRLLRATCPLSARLVPSDLLFDDNHVFYGTTLLFVMQSLGFVGMAWCLVHSL